MKESTTYQAILEEGVSQGVAQGVATGIGEGRLKEARALLLRLGEKRFGPPAPAISDALARMNDLSKIEAMIVAVIDRSGWEDLLQSRD